MSNVIMNSVDGVEYYVCPVCGLPFLPTRSDMIYCGSACRQAAYRLRKFGSRRRRKSKVVHRWSLDVTSYRH